MTELLLSAAAIHELLLLHLADVMTRLPLDIRP